MWQTTQQPHSQVMVHWPLAQHLEHTERHVCVADYTATPQPSHGPPATDTTPRTQKGMFVWQTTQQTHSQVMVHRPLAQHLEHTERHVCVADYTTTPQPSHGPPATDTAPRTHRKACLCGRLHNNPTAKSWSTGHWHST